MKAKPGNKLLFKVALLLLMLILGGLIFAGCGIGTVPKGWSGGTIIDDTLFVVSMEGELVAVDITDGRRTWIVPLEVAESSGGGFGCAPKSSAVAVYGSPAVGEDLIYVGGYNGKVYAFTHGRNEPRWVYPRQGSIGAPIVGGIVIAQDKIYFGAADGKLYALDAADGFSEWVFETGNKIWSTPVIDGDTLFIGSFDNKLYALNASDGSKKWEFETEGAIVATPVVQDGTVYIGSFDRYLYAVDAVGGSLKWKFMAENWFWAKPLVSGGVVYAANLDGKVYALDAKSGTKLVEFDLRNPVSSSPVVTGNSVVVATEQGVVYTLGIDDHQQRQIVSWEEEQIYSSLAVSNGIVYIHTNSDKLYALDIQSGAVREFNIN